MSLAYACFCLQESAVCLEHTLTGLVTVLTVSCLVTLLAVFPVAEKPPVVPDLSLNLAVSSAAPGLYCGGSTGGVCIGSTRIACCGRLQQS